MTVEILIIVFLSASLHPFRDLLLKGLYSPDLCYFSISLMWVVFAIQHALVVGAPLMISLDYLPFIFGSAIGLFIYYYGTLLALKKGDLSVCYPIIRSSPVFIVFVGWAVLDHSYSWILLLGIAVVLTGVFLIQRGSGAQVKLVTQPVVLALALAAMAGAGIYSLVDSIAMQRTASLGTQPLHASTFLIWVYVALSVFFWLALLMSNRSLFPLSKQFGGLWKRHPWRLLGASAMSYASYVLILTAYEKGGNVAAVTSLRLWSIPLTIIMSSLLLKEDGFGRRLAASGVIVAGIMVIVWGG